MNLLVMELIVSFNYFHHLTIKSTLIWIPCKFIFLFEELLNSVKLFDWIIWSKGFQFRSPQKARIESWNQWIHQGFVMKCLLVDRKMPRRVRRKSCSEILFSWVRRVHLGPFIHRRLSQKANQRVRTSRSWLSLPIQK